MVVLGSLRLATLVVPLSIWQVQVCIFVLLCLVLRSPLFSFLSIVERALLPGGFLHFQLVPALLLVLALLLVGWV